MFMKVKLLLSVLLAAFCSGCVTAEGIGFTSDPYVNKSFVKYGALPDASTEAESGDRKNAVTGYIVVGTVSAFREFKRENIEEEYKDYAEDFELWGTGRQPNLGLEDFSKIIRGWTRIKVVGVPLLFAGYVKGLVPYEAARDIDFEPVLATALFQSSSDLVAAKTNSDGILTVVTVLCKDTAGYSECAKSYKKGVFDSNTGLKLSGKLEVSEGGPRIDPITFELIDSESSDRDASHREPG